jgi:hypothetical protein
MNETNWDEYSLAEIEQAVFGKFSNMLERKELKAIIQSLIGRILYAEIRA